MQLVSACCNTFCREERGVVETVALGMTDDLLPVLHDLRAQQHTGLGSALRKGQNAVCTAIITVHLEGCPRCQAAGVALPGHPRPPHTHGAPVTASVVCATSPARPAPTRLREMPGVPGGPRSDRGQHRRPS